MQQIEQQAALAFESDNVIAAEDGMVIDVLLPPAEDALSTEVATVETTVVQEVETEVDSDGLVERRTTEFREVRVEVGTPR